MWWLRAQEAHWLFTLLNLFLTMCEGLVESIERSVVSQNENRIMEVAHPRRFGHCSMTGMLIKSEADFVRVG